MSERTKIIKQKIPNLKPDHLEDLRGDLGITIVEMADIIGISEASYHRMKNSGKALSKERSAFILYLKSHYSPAGLRKIYTSAAAEKKHHASKA